MSFLLTGSEISAQEAYRFKIVQQIVEDGSSKDIAMTIAERIATASPAAAQATIANSRIAASQNDESAVEHLKALTDQLISGADALEGFRAFQEKRAPRFDTHS